MTLRVTHLRIKPGYVDSLKKVYNLELLPIMRAQLGFLFAYLYQDTVQDTTECLSITAWQERINFDVFMGSASYKEYAEKVRPFIDTEMPRRAYEMAAGGEKA